MEVGFKIGGKKGEDTLKEIKFSPQGNYGGVDGGANRNFPSQGREWEEVEIVESFLQLRIGSYKWRSGQLFLKKTPKVGEIFPKSL
ncbi:MAG: hypothetical protein C6I01_00375 [Epsilonproteobacteria bacterium]|nr:hypothetical protein [Campylobacterota bacterium]